jgi:hypothetical protein
VDSHPESFLMLQDFKVVKYSFTQSQLTPGRNYVEKGFHGTTTCHFLNHF